ncbi:hypothetical protein EI77_03967 [Prosthecobacter fusiformis]|uniref:PsbP protein n=1 Tax=Prosthecobacter fusiformis TaxID=48464 RepID=A0A4R7RK01_9BACT|nr:hypothetical protein [Prosthecobacter fusiformis]TDU64517.1 hypothetical protein EI77_03967 [Prosthecobacter fusiformis]
MRYLTLFILFLMLGSLSATEKVPAGFVMQVMEPTGGKILRPKGWFYNEGHRSNAWMWTISKEDTHDGKDPYDTGVRIQAVAGVQERTGKSPEVFLKEFIAQKRKAADKVHKNCDAVDQGLFTRTCIEVTEREYRILYSVFWSNEIDMIVISIAGAKTTDWEANSKFFDTMSAFELIDMKRFPDDPKKK